jgi:hypothetical protein
MLTGNVGAVNLIMVWIVAIMVLQMQHIIDQDASRYFKFEEQFAFSEHCIGDGSQ